jgi:anaerobic magnesium-protoporphyrin IX monomethyl ester cyclase
MRERKVLLLNPPAKSLTFRDYYCSFTSKANYYWPPIDLLVLSGILSSHYQVEVIDAIAEGITAHECFDRIIAKKPDVTVFLTGTASWKGDFDFMARIRNTWPMTTIASGGLLLRKGLEFMSRFEFLDSILLDFTTDDIVDYLEGQDKPFGNLIFRKNGNIITGERMITREQFQIPLPRHELFPLNKYRLPTAQRRPVSSILASFGCPYRCRFCIGGTVSYKLRATENVIEELEYISVLGIKEAYFADFTFTADKKHVMEICQQMIDRQLDLTWLCNVHSRTLDEEVLRVMKNAGCHTVQIGVESGSDEILRKYAKATDKETIIRAFDLCRKLKIKTVGYFMIGLPGEDRKVVLQTIKFAKALAPNFASFAITTPDIGTPLWQEAIEKGWFDPAIDEFDSTGYPVMETKKLSKEEVWQLKNRANLEFYMRPSYLVTLLKSVRRPRDVWELAKEGFGLIKNMLPRQKIRN